MLLNLDKSNAFQYRENEDCKDAKGSDIFYHYNVELFAFEVSADIHFLNNFLGLENISNKQAGDECDDRHNHAVGDKVKHFKEVESDGFN